MTAITLLIETEGVPTYARMYVCTCWWPMQEKIRVGKLNVQILLRGNSVISSLPYWIC